MYITIYKIQIGFGRALCYVLNYTLDVKFRIFLEEILKLDAQNNLLLYDLQSEAFDLRWKISCCIYCFNCMQAYPIITRHTAA